jgi:hypothetical protein
MLFNDAFITELMILNHRTNALNHTTNQKQKAWSIQGVMEVFNGGR